MAKIDIGNGMWYDSEEDRLQREFYKLKEKELYEWIFSGQRTIDMFGQEGAKRILARQAREDAKLGFNHKSRGGK